MSSVAYGNGGVPLTDDPSNASIPTSSSGAIIQHPYLNSNTNVAYAAAAAAAAASSASPSSSVGQYQHYYGHPLPQQQLLHVQQAGFYPTANLNHHQHHGDFSNSSPSVASSTSSVESPRKTTTRKRHATDSEKATGANISTKSGSKRKPPINDDDDLDEDDDEENKCYLRGAPPPNVMMANNHNSSNHPGSSSGGGGGEEDKEKQARENHCEIERRRRVKMATYFAELCDMVPSCSNLARKPDKLTILRMAAQFMKNLRTNNNSLSIGGGPQVQQQQQQHDLHKPSFLNDQELKYLMVESCDAFLFALNCDTLRIIFISDAIQHILSYTCQDWYSRFFYDFVHPDDVEKVREQLNLQQQDGSPGGGSSGRVLDLKTGTVKKEGHATVSSKRSFICRLRVGSTNPLDHTHQSPFINPCVLRRRHRTSLGPSIDGHLYEVVHISGYIRNLNNHHHPHHDNPNHHPASSSSSSNVNGQMAFVAIARIQNSCSPNVNDLTNGTSSALHSISTEFTCRCHWDTGEILFIDQRCAPIVGFKSHELLHKILFDQIHIDDQAKLQELHKRTVAQKNLPGTSSSAAANLTNTNIICRFRTNIDNEYVPLKTSTYAFCNPCTDDVEFIIVTFLSTLTSASLINKPPPTTSIATSVISNPNDYTRQQYDAYARAGAAASGAIVANPTRYASTSTADTTSPTYVNPEGQDYGGDSRTYVSNNGGSTWGSGSDNWTTTTTTAPPPGTDYVDTQALYHHYHQ